MTVTACAPAGDAIKLSVADRDPLGRLIAGSDHLATYTRDLMGASENERNRC